MGTGLIEHTTRFRTVTLPRLAMKTTGPGILLRTAIGPFMHKLKSRDIVHICAPAFPETFTPSVLSHILRVPFVVDIDDWWGFDPDGSRSGFESYFEQAFEEKSVKLANEVITASSVLREKIKAYSKRDPLLIPNGVNPLDFDKLDHEKCRKALVSDLNLESDSRIVSVAYDVNFIGMLDSLSKSFSRERKEVYLLVVGLPEGQLQNPNVLRMPKLRRDEWIRLITGSDVILMPMQDTVWERARFPIKLAEYMATGRPIVSSAVGESRHILEEAGYPKADSRFSFRSDSEATNSVHRLLDEIQGAESVGQEARAFALNTLSWENITASYLEGVRSIIRT